jgi:alkanesulfonate monooxygenase SsuD/methylene tetrahydromethanopterin reductase-like flavin-dependent oxidoreductase (luciferase family)
VTSHDGEFFNYKFLNPWPKPFQKPHPPIYVVGSGSRETVELAVEFGLGYSIVFVPIAAQLKAFELMRELAAERGRTVRPDELIVIAAVYVADTDEEAMREARPYYEKFFTWFHKVPPKFLLPPGYVSTDEFLRRVSDTALANSAEATWDEIVASQRIAFGSPDTVADLILHWAEEAQCTRVNLLMQHADMPEWMVAKNLTLFANEVIPRIRAKGALVGATA